LKHSSAHSNYFFWGIICALAATIIWSGNFIVARGLSGQFPPVQLAWFRWLVATVILLPLGFREILRERERITANIGFLSLAALVGVTVFNTLIYISGRYTTALNLALIATFTPVFILLLSRLFLNESITLRKMVGIAIAVFGVVSLVTKGDYSRLAGLDLNLGDLGMLFASGLFAAYSILVRKKPRELGQIAFLTSTFTLGLLFLSPWALWENLRGGAVTFSPEAIGAILYIGIGASLISYLLWNRAVLFIGPARAGFIYYSLPLFSGIEALLILGEPVTMAHFYSGLFIIGGIVLATKPFGSAEQHNFEKKPKANSLPE
jgi:drug/metabolite transporter (DMT)-like permease